MKPKFKKLIARTISKLRKAEDIVQNLHRRNNGFAIFAKTRLRMRFTLLSTVPPILKYARSFFQPMQRRVVSSNICEYMYI